MMNDMLPPRRGQSRSVPGYTSRPVAHHAVPHPSANPFRTPQNVAATEEQQGDTVSAGNLVSDQNHQPPKGRRSLKEWWQDLSKKQQMIFGLIAALILIGLGLAAYFLFFKSDGPPPKPAVVQKREVAPPPPTTVASALTGLQVEPAFNDRPVIGVMIENTQVARPQSGLLQAGVVFEAIAEGGITRFVALFQDTEPDYVGPVRSARPYYLQWVLGFDAAYAHAGGSPDALANISQWGVKDLNHNTSAFWRISERDAPHNLYTGIAKLREYATSKGYGKSNFASLARKAEQASGTPSAKSINLNISSATFNVHYDYDQATNAYKRSVGGAPHTDQRSGTQLAPKVVVALVLPQGSNGKYTTYNTIGSGQVFVFQDGTVSTGTWKKGANNENFTFTDNNGAAIKLNPGQTWFTVVGGADRVTFAT